jgi:RNA polymerase sigma factor (sigma-70 family)
VTADIITDPGSASRTLKDSPFQSLEEFLETVAWRVEHEARKIAGRRTPQDQEDLVSEANVVLMKCYRTRKGDLHLVTGKWIHVVARRAMSDYIGRQSTWSRRVWQDLCTFRRFKAQLEASSGRELSNEEALAKSEWRPSYRARLLAALTTRVSGGLEASEELLHLADTSAEDALSGHLFGEMVPELLRRIEALPPIQREVITAYYLQGQSLKDIAAARNRTIAAVSFQKLAGFKALSRHFLRPQPQPQKQIEPIESLMKLTNQTAVRRYALDVIKQERPGLSDKFTRVGSEFFEAVEAATRAAIVPHQVPQLQRKDPPMNNTPDKNYLSFADRERETHELVILCPEIDGERSEDYDDILKISHCREFTFRDWHVCPEGLQREDGVDIMRFSHTVAFLNARVAAGAKYAFTIKGGSKEILLRNVIITRPGKYVDIDLGNYSHNADGKTGKVTLDNVVRVRRQACPGPGGLGRPAGRHRRQRQNPRRPILPA